MSSRVPDTLSRGKEEVFKQSQNGDSRKKAPTYGNPSSQGPVSAGPNDAVSGLTRTESAGFVRSRRSEPKNFNAGAPGSDSKFNFKAFSKTGFLSEFDEYQDPYKIVNKYRNTDRAKITNMHGGTDFKPSGSAARLKKNHEYIADPASERPQTAQSTSQKNFFTSPPKKGFSGTNGITLGKNPEYISDPFERKRELQSKEWLEHKKKMGRNPFFITFKKKKCFTPDFAFYRIPSGLKEHKEPEHNSQPYSDTRPAFRPNNPAKIGYNRTLGKFPEYIPEPEPETEVRPKTSQDPWRYNREEKMKFFRYTTKWTTGPTPSVQQYNNLFRPHASQSNLNN